MFDQLEASDSNTHNVPYIVEFNSNTEILYEENKEEKLGSIANPGDN
jgi:hypothetical protein